MLSARQSVYSITGVGVLEDDISINCRPIRSCNSPYFPNVRFHHFPAVYSTKSLSCCLPYGVNMVKLKQRFGVVSLKSSFGSFNSSSPDHIDDDEDHYVEAIVLIQETIEHYYTYMHKIGIQGLTKQRKPDPFHIHSKNPLSKVNHIGSAFLRQFQPHTIFLKISCNGDFVLPIIVGQYAVERLIDSYEDDERGECTDYFQLTRDLMKRTGYKVKMVKITDRVANTYFAKIIFYKPGDSFTYSVDARPSDAINVARRCKAPIYVNKEIVLADATRILYGLSRTSNKSVYDVCLDSAPDEPDLLSEELYLVKNMNMAADEERFDDAAMWRNKLKKLLE